ncbi:hypothetical protein HOY82DRAFT_586146 [Tuber indicum]|nr:hypothetical protein HOY82DRAFT_586146 [Tuber indicum]
MIVGTDLSGRLLHMYSGRICRWLRKKFGMYQFADGLVERKGEKAGGIDRCSIAYWRSSRMGCITAGGKGLVIQLFTRDKREEEVELEYLWGKELERDAKKREAERRAFGRELSARFPIPGSVQARAFHSSSQQPLQVVTGPPTVSIVRFVEEGINLDTRARKGHSRRLVPRVSEAFDPDADLKNAAYLMEAHMNHLRNRFCENNYTGKITGGCKLHGQGVADRTSTRFLQSYLWYLPKHPAPVHLRLQLQVISFLKALAAPASVELYYMCMRAIANSPEHRSYSLPDLAEHFGPASSLSQHISEFQFWGKRADGAIGNIRIWVGTDVLDPRLAKMERKSIEQKCHSYAIREYVEQAMTAHVTADHWTALWNRWKNLKYMSVRWDQGFYKLLIGLVVLGAKQKEVVYAARHIWNDMERETPPVLMTAGIAKGPLAVVQLAERDSSVSRGFVELRARCNGYLDGWHKWRAEKGLVGEEESAVVNVVREEKVGEGVGVRLYYMMGSV